MSDFVGDTPGKVLEALKGLQKGLKAKGLPGGAAEMPVEGKKYTLNDLQTAIDADVATYQAVEDKAVELEGLTKTRDEAAPAIVARLSGVRAAIKAGLGRKSPDLSAYDMEPDKDPPPLTLSQKQERSAKAQATRAARHTVGPKAKKAIKGQVPPQTPPAGH